MGALHFLRPLWFLALLPLAASLEFLRRRRRAGRSWEAVVDARLLPHLLIGSGQQRKPWSIAAIVLGGVLAVTALAGPVWTKLQQPVFRRESALVILLDLSRSMDAADLAPSRLQLAKFKLRDILARRKEGDTALVVYAADPFVVTPLTTDVDNIVRQLPSLTTDLMPQQGSRTDRAIAKAQALLRQNGAVDGDVLLITDGVDNDPPAALHAAVKALLDSGYRLSVLGVGTSGGAPIPLAQGGFFKDANGAIVLPKLDEPALERLAAQGHGIYRRIAPDDSDTEALTRSFGSGGTMRHAQQVAGVKADQWREEGPWLLLPLLPLAALAFRRGYLLLLCLALLLPLPRSAYAFGWQDLWQRADQRGAQALAAQQPQLAAKLFKDPQWRAAAHYRAKDFRASLNDLDGQHSAVADYNRGNTLAHLGQFREALRAYDDALKSDPTLKDAEYNRKLVKNWLQASQSQSAANGRRQSNGSQQQGPGQKAQDGRQQQSATNGVQQQPTGRSPSPQTAQANGSATPATPQNTGADASASAAAQHDRSGREENNKMRKEPQQAQTEDQQAKQTGQATADAAQPQRPGEESSTQKEAEQATAQWLRRIPDDPGGLWRRKFLYQYKREYRSQQSESKPW